MTVENIQLGDKYFQTGAKTIVGPTKKRKYKAQPTELLGISAVIGRIIKQTTKQKKSIPAVALISKGSEEPESHTI